MTLANLAGLDAAVRAVCPIDGVSGDGEIFFQAIATDAQKSAAQAVVASFNMTAPTATDVQAERTRRLALGFDYNFNDSRGIHHIGTTDEDMVGWDEVAKAASAKIALGQPAATFNIVTNTGPATVTAMEFQSILDTATAVRQPIWAASFVLQAMNPIPSDYTADHYWTSGA